MLTGRKGLAKVSATPGKTRLLNFFLINQKWHLVDLPGYGYARVSKSERRTLENLINGYFERRAELYCAFVLIDSNLPPTKIDLEFVHQMGLLQVPFVLVFTKADKAGQKLAEENIAAFMHKLSETWETLPHYFVTSSERRTGRDELLQYIDQSLKA